LIGYTQGEHGLREFIELEKKIRAERKKTAHAELERIQKLKDIGAALLVAVLGVGSLGFLVALILAIKDAR
jgi:archaellum biogenesis protein FlaJ (TadC family)